MIKRAGNDSRHIMLRRDAAKPMPERREFTRTNELIAFGAVGQFHVSDSIGKSSKDIRVRIHALGCLSGLRRQISAACLRDGRLVPTGTADWWVSKIGNAGTAVWWVSTIGNDWHGGCPGFTPAAAGVAVALLLLLIGTYAVAAPEGVPA